MVRQIVLLRWREGISEEEKTEVALGLRSLQEKIGEVRAIKMGSDLRVRSDNFDFGISVDFDDKEGYLNYRKHPAHLDVVERLIGPAMAERAGLVFEY